MSLQDKVETKSFLVRPAQKELLDILFNRLRNYEQSVQAKANELRSALEEAIFFVKKDLGVPLTEPYLIKANEDGTVSFVPAPPPTTQAPPVNVGMEDVAQQLNEASKS